jgi:predicted dehydrogenase
METINKKIQIEQLNLGFVGLGWIGYNRMEKLLTHPKVTCRAIVEPVQENANRALALDKNIEVYQSLNEVIADPFIEGIVIATPSAMHTEQTIAALSAGKAVFCQKPLGRNFNEVQQAIKASAKNNKLLTVDLSYRYTKAFKAVHNVIQKGELGKIFAIDLVFHNAYGPDKPWFFNIEESGGGCVLDLGIHMLDLALWSLNFPKVHTIQSHLYKSGKKLNHRERTVEDYASVLLATEDGIAINLQCSWHISAGREAVIEAKYYGTQGSVAFKNVNGSFYDFTAEKYQGTQTITLVSSPDDWGGRAGLVWADELMASKGYDPVTAHQLLELADLIDKIYEQ